MSAGKIIAYVFAAILIFFGVLFIWATFSPEGQLGWLVVGVISVGIGFGLIWFAGRQKSEAGNQDGDNVTLKIDLPGDVNLALDEMPIVWGYSHDGRNQDGSWCSCCKLPLL